MLSVVDWKHAELTKRPHKLVESPERKNESVGRGNATLAHKSRTLCWTTVRVNRSGGLMPEG